ncbi:hypothetical protein [Bacteroides ovatus]|mgnify:CR=1 FL=1|uniref:Sialate O-acetylesterase domain-containing protein n=1 Tax=Bacteroides ovatus TaxID=28116 RepID=A0A1G8CQD2_BACOV|nr:hypothetical protein [Bacteroides ovatus]SDH47646.1 hypothetical protein SAMN05192582_100692 [Bacteroides ovatus]
MKNFKLIAGTCLALFCFGTNGAMADNDPQKQGEKKKPEMYLHFIMDGQSLSTGHQSYPTLSTENVPGNYMISNQVWINYGNLRRKQLKPLVGNIALPFRQGNDVMSRSAGTFAESPLIGAVNHVRMQAPKLDKIVATSVGYSGASVEELSKESETRTHYKDFETAVSFASQIMEKRGDRIQCPVIFWMQGEFNYGTPNPEKGLKKNEPNTLDRQEYKRLMLNLKNNMQNEVVEKYGQKKKPVWITYQTGAQYMRDTLAISMAQLEASNENADVICAGPVYPMTDRGGHLDANGYRWFGEMLGKVYYQTQVKGKEFKPLQPQEIQLDRAAKQIRIKFHVPVPPLALDVNTLPKIRDYGFEVYLDKARSENRVNITDVKLDKKDMVVLTCDKPLEGDVLIMYAGSGSRIENQPEGLNHLQGHGNLRDSDPAKGFYKYIDLDGKNADGTFIYPREKFESRLRPDYEPKDASGKVIYNQNYPLYNFCVGFYYKLATGVDKLRIL